MPEVGAVYLRILSPTVLELVRITVGTDTTTWNFVNPPGSVNFEVSADGSPVSIQQVGFKRRPLYAPLVPLGLRIENSLYLTLNSPLADGASVEVTNPNGQFWPNTMRFTSVKEPLRYSPAIHVNQEGYLPNYPKKAMVGYYLGNLGEMLGSSNLGWQLIDAVTGNVVYTNNLTARPDIGWNDGQAQYQNVLEADFSGFTTPGKYRLTVPGLGASFPFVINEGVAMNLTRAYALGLYHQRCGGDNALPYTRFVHGACHTLAAFVPKMGTTNYPNATSINFINSVLLDNSGKINLDNPPQTAPRLSNINASLYPIQNSGTIDVSKGHHDAGDYSKYTINSAQLIHTLVFAADSFQGVGALDNLGIPESGDGISDFLQLAKWEADFLAKMQDSDGGFYFLVYPEYREYEANVLPDQGDRQVVFPKTTSVTAAAVAALAETGSSPRFRASYPTEANAYLAKAQAGWSFLTNAINQHGKPGAYQKITHYGDVFTHDDELAWAAAAMFAATGSSVYYQKLTNWYPNVDAQTTKRWGWWRLFEGYGCAVRTYAFAARSGRRLPSELNSDYLQQCEAQIQAAAAEERTWSEQNAYGTGLAPDYKRLFSPTFYFSSDRDFDIAVAQQITPS
ncbi:MAG: glycoside hydrolase family 9 protein, partial [Limisphaerales bacterium]